MKKELARLISKRITKSAEKSTASRKTIVGYLPIPKELKKGE